MATCSSVNNADSPTLSFIMEHLTPEPDWYDLGKKLSLQQATLEDIAVNNLSVDKERCLSEVIKKWLENEDCEDGRLEVLAKALEDMGRADLSSKIKNESKDETKEVPLPTTAEADSDYVTATTAVIEQSLSMQSIDKSLTVLKESSELQYQFSQLMSSVESELERIPLTKIRRFVAREIKGFSYTKSPSSVQQVMIAVNNFYYYLNFDLIATIVHHFLPTSNLCNRLREYGEATKHFTNIVQIKHLSQCDLTPIGPYNGVDTMSLTLASCWLNMSLEDLHKLIQILFQDESRYLTHMRVDGETLCVTWLAPRIIMISLASSARTQEKFLKQVGILNLTISHETILQQPVNKAEISLRVLNNALLSASVEGNTLKTGLLISLGADLDCSGETGVTPLMLACKLGNTRTVEQLLKSNASVNQVNKNGNTALMAAATSGNEEIIKMLLAYNANPHVRGSNNHTALSVAALRGHKEAVSLLLWIDANPNIQTENGWTPLMYAASQGDTTMTKVLLKCDADIDIARSDGQTAITEATEHGHTDIVRLMKAYKILRSKGLTRLEENPSPMTLQRRRSIPLSLNYTPPSIERRGSTGGNSIGIRSSHSNTAMYSVSEAQNSVPRSIFRPTTNRGVSLYSSSKNTSGTRLIKTKKR